jgi:hypothetical protein
VLAAHGHMASLGASDSTLVVILDVTRLSLGEATEPNAGESDHDFITCGCYCWRGPDPGSVHSSEPDSVRSFLALWEISGNDQTLGHVESGHWHACALEGGNGRI